MRASGFANIAVHHQTSTNQPTDRPTNQSTNQPINQFDVVPDGTRSSFMRKKNLTSRNHVMVFSDPAGAWPCLCGLNISWRTSYYHLKLSTSARQQRGSDRTLTCRNHMTMFFDPAGAWPCVGAAALFFPASFLAGRLPALHVRKPQPTQWWACSHS